MRKVVGSTPHGRLVGCLLGATPRCINIKSLPKLGMRDLVVIRELLIPSFKIKNNYYKLKSHNIFIYI